MPVLVRAAEPGQPGDKDEQIENIKHDLEWRVQQMSQQQSGVSQKDEEIARLRGEAERLRADAQAKITQLQERIKELNQKLMAVQPVKK